MKNPDALGGFVATAPKTCNREIYLGWDVHRNTPFFKEVMPKYRECFPERITLKEHILTIGELEQKYGPLPAIAKMRQRFQEKDGGYRCPDLKVNIAAVLQETWNLVKKVNDPSIFAGFGEILRDVGTTCVQGDSHRLISYYIPLRGASPLTPSNL